MRSTFMGLEANKRGLYTQQAALYTTGHNLANANTLGYSRQRVNMSPTSPFPGVGLNAGTMPGFIGTGVQAGSIQRIRDQFVDQQFRQETNKLGYWESRSNAIEQMEDIINEPSEFGLQKSFSLFWQSLSDLAANSANGGARAVVTDRAAALAEAFNYANRSLKEVQGNLKKEIDVSTKDINSILDQIAALNKQIMEVEPNGYMPNDLYDARDVLLDELSLHFPVEVEYGESGGRALAIAEGPVTVSIKIDGQSIVLVDGKDRASLKADYDAGNGLFNKLEVSELKDITTDALKQNSAATEIAHDKFPKVGKYASLIKSYGTADGKGLYPEMLDELDKLVGEFVNAFNEQHGKGFDLNGQPGEPFFTGTTAADIAVNEDIVKDSSLIAAADKTSNNNGIIVGEEGNGKNAQALADIQTKVLGTLGGASVQTYFEGMIGALGVEGQQAVRNQANSEVMLGSAAHRRASISSVSLDEEMTDMIRFQQAYNASARMITVIDETLDKLINGMGRVGL